MTINTSDKQGGARHATASPEESHTPKDDGRSDQKIETQTISDRSENSTKRADQRIDDHSSEQRRRTAEKDAQKASDSAEPQSDEGRETLRKRAPSYPPGFVRQYELVERVKAYDPQADEDLLNKAYVFSMKAHGEQKRSSGDPYFTHPISVAAILTDLKADPATIATALLHDTVEDTDATIEDIKEKFGAEVAALVDGVTKLSQMEMNSEETKQAENFRKLIMAVSKDVRVLLVKLADRLHNMRTLHFTKPEKRKRVSLETMEIYAPLAGRIGVQRFRDELEELSFKYLNPAAYESISEGLERLGKDAVHSVVTVAQVLRARLEEANLEADISSREKKSFSIWRKMERKGNTFEELADIYAFRVIVGTIEECYQVLGVIHQNFPAIHDEFDDYISSPKPNGYRSIHTAVLAPVGEDRTRQRVEIQIRTVDMHETAERGVAAHWRYKEASARESTGRSIEIDTTKQRDPNKWAREAGELLSEGIDPSEFLEDVKMELYKDQVFCFTPKGRVIALPAGATPIDFAYGVHSDIGDACVGATINRVTRSLRTPLKNSDVVDILRSENAPIPKDWQSLAVTSRARSAISRRIKKLKRDEQRELGRRILDAEFAAHALTLSDKAIREALKRLNMNRVRDVYEAVGNLSLPVKIVRETAFPGMAALDHGHAADDPIGKKRYATTEPVILEGLTDGVSVYLAQCCGPLPGERIIGLPQSEKGVAVHKMDCDALAHTDLPEEDWLDLKWRANNTSEFVAPILLSTNNRIGTLAEIFSVLARYEVDVVNFSLRNREVSFSEMLIDITVQDARQLSHILTGLRASEHVIRADRRVEATR